MAKKREEKPGKSSPVSKHDRKKNGASPSPAIDQYDSLNKQLAAMGLSLREVPGDGNCLFRALGDQLDGHMRHHMKHRQDVVGYIRNHREDFEPFVEDDVSFDTHVNDLAQAGTYAGNDALVAFARFHRVSVVIHQLNAPMWQVHGCDHPSSQELHLAYHNGDHYNSVRRAGDNSQVPATVRLLVSPSHSPKSLSHNSTIKSHTKELSPTSCSAKLRAPSPTKAQKMELERRVAQEVDCDDIVAVQKALQMCNYNYQKAVEFLLSVEDLDDSDCASLWSEHGSGTRIFGAEVSATVRNGTKPKASTTSHLSNRKRRELKKQERKQESESRKGNGKKSPPSDHDSDSSDTTIIVRNMDCLNI